MAKKKFNFTVATIKDIEPGGGADRVYVYDAKTPGLAFCVTASGSRSFYFYKWQDGRPKRERIGGYPDLTIEQARRCAADLNNDVARGVDHRAEARGAGGGDVRRALLPLHGDKDIFSAGDITSVLLDHAGAVTHITKTISVDQGIPLAIAVANVLINELRDKVAGKPVNTQLPLHRAEWPAESASAASIAVA